MSYNTDENIKIIRSKRKTVSIEITKDSDIVVRAPYFMREADIERFVSSKSDWLAKHLENSQRNARERAKTSLTDEQIRDLTEKAKKELPERVAYYAGIIGVKYGRITIRRQKTRWGSCSSKGNLNFNCLLMLTPNEVIDYVVVHELCHLKQLNHSEKFWREVARVMPDYKIYEKWLKENGSKLIGN